MTDQTAVTKGHNKGFIALAAILAIVLAVCTILATTGIFNNDIPTQSTVDRSPLVEDRATMTSYAADDGNLIDDYNALQKGMSHFYIETGVQPYIITYPKGTFGHWSALEQMADYYYDEVFDDQSHLLVVFNETNDGSYQIGLEVGDNAKKVVDEEAIQIFRDYLDRNYNNPDLNMREVFSNTFEQTANKIMHKDTFDGQTVVIDIAIIAGCALVVLLIAMWYTNMKRKKNQEK